MSGEIVIFFIVFIAAMALVGSLVISGRSRGRRIRKRIH
jgi:hypothetical protein